MSYQSEIKKFVLPRLRSEGIYGRVFAINGGDLEQQVLTTCVLCARRVEAILPEKYVNSTIDRAKLMPTIVCSLRQIQLDMDDPDQIEGACETLARLDGSAYINEDQLDDDMALMVRKKRLGKI